MRLPIAIALLATLITARAAVVYEKDVAPILRTYCAGCHNNEEHENEFSVETFARLRKGGEDKGDPIKSGAPEESFLIKSLENRVRPHMPPKDEPQVPAAELAILKEWIAAGAHGPQRDGSILQSIVVPKIATTTKRSPISALAYSPDGKRIAVATSGRIEVRNSPGGKSRLTITNLHGKITAVHFSADGKQLIAAGGVAGLNGIAQLFDTKTGTLIREFAGHRDTLYDAELSPDGATLATAGYDKSIRLWQTPAAKLIRTINVHNGAIFDLAFDPSGKVIASASADQTVKLWRVSDGVRLDTLNQPQGELNNVAFTPDGQHILAAGADKRIHMWRFVSREDPVLNPVIHSRFAHEAPITAFALSADGHQLITAASDRSLKIWSLPDLTEQFAYESQPDIVSALVPRKNSFVASRLDGSLQVYEIRTERPKKSTPSIAARKSSDKSSPFTPLEFKGVIAQKGEADTYKFTARAGEELTLAINAAQSQSPLDSRLEVLTVDGKPIEQIVLQATRDSWFTFRGKDSDTSGDFRLHNWAEMELNEYLYANGEVVQLWLYPRGPDSGFLVYPGEGKRHTAFNTTALVHPVNEPAYTVIPLPPGSQPPPNGLPIFRLNYVNDDDPYRRAGTDSLLLFTAPKDGEYVARVTDTRGFGGTNFNYTLTIRERRPDFEVSLEGANPQISPGSGREIRFIAKRVEGFAGPIHIDIANLPAGFTASSPIEIEANQIAAVAAIYAAADAKTPETNSASKIKITARSQINGRELAHEISGLGLIKLGEKPKLTVEILPGPDRSYVKEIPGQPLEFTIRPGQTITARVRATRHDFKDRIELGVEDSNRNLPHGLYIDNIGLNGLLIVEGQTEREFFITATKIAKPSVRTFHLRAKADGNQVSPYALIRIVPPSSSQTVAKAAP
ncbi:MAG TPA: c-type cytochrome domain-containing protein [Verrucomicrobiae bacterium]|nr:c-type cytochrome domain-containing protein [Verrucomicrobiae bacterium]